MKIKEILFGHRINATHTSDIIRYFSDKLKSYDGEFTFQYEAENVMIVFMGHVHRTNVWYDCEPKITGLTVDCFDVYVDGKLVSFYSDDIVADIFKMIKN